MIGAGIQRHGGDGAELIGSYFEKDHLTTVQYPEERDVLPENSRNFPFLVFDTNASRQAGGDDKRLRAMKA